MLDDLHTLYVLTLGNAHSLSEGLHEPHTQAFPASAKKITVVYFLARCREGLGTRLGLHYTAVRATPTLMRDWLAVKMSLLRAQYFTFLT